jgi:hypothetical protein
MIPSGAKFANGIVSFFTQEGAETVMAQPMRDVNGDGDTNDTILRAYEQRVKKPS